MQHIITSAVEVMLLFLFMSVCVQACLEISKRYLTDFAECMWKVKSWAELVFPAGITTMCPKALFPFH